MVYAGDLKGGVTYLICEFDAKAIQQFFLKNFQTIWEQINQEQGTEDRYLSEPEKAHPTGEFVIVVKFGGHVLCHLAYRLADVIRQGGSQTKNLDLQILYSSFYNCLYLALVTLKQFNKGT